MPGRTAFPQPPGLLTGIFASPRNMRNVLHIITLLAIFWCVFPATVAHALDYSPHHKEVQRLLPLIIKEMTGVTGKNPPSNKLREHVDDLEWQLWTLRGHRDEHFYSPPDLSPIFQQCEEIQKKLDKLEEPIIEKKKEIERIKHRKEVSRKAYRRLAVKRFNTYIAAQVGLLIGVLPTSTGWTAAGLIDQVTGGVLSKVKVGNPNLKEFTEFKTLNPGTPFQELLNQRVEKWCQAQKKSGKLDCSDPDNAETMALRTFYELEQLAKEKAQQYGKMQTKLEGELRKLEADTILTRSNLEQYLDLCAKLRKIKLWTPRKMAPKMTLTKTFAPAQIKKNDEVTYTYILRNTGNVPLENVTVNDDKCAPVKLVGGDSDGDKALSLKEQWTFECSMVLTADTTNTATATATSPGGATHRVADSASVILQAAVVAGPCPPPKVKVPGLIGLPEAEAMRKLQDAGLQGQVEGKVEHDQIPEKAVISHDPIEGTCVAANSMVGVILSLGPDKPPPPPPPADGFSVEFDCGDSFELAPGDFVGRGCGLVVQGWKDNGKRVEVEVEYPRQSGLEIFPGDTSAPPSLMYTPGVTDYYDRYIFNQSFRAKSTAPAGLTTVNMTVSQEGAGSVSLSVTVSVLEKGQLPSTGPGIRPPANVVTGSGGEFCVWRYRIFGDPPPCFHFVKAKCDTPRYNSPQYELVGANMTWAEGGAHMSRLSSYFDDAYGCRGGTGANDKDGDGVVDDEDQCPGTPKNATVDDTGCSDSQRDSDGDGVADSDDDCPATPAGATVGADGCVDQPKDKDSDGDGVVDDRDMCPGTEPGKQVDQSGCVAATIAIERLWVSGASGGGQPVHGQGLRWQAEVRLGNPSSTVNYSATRLSDGSTDQSGVQASGRSLSLKGFMGPVPKTLRSIADQISLTVNTGPDHSDSRKADFEWQDEDYFSHFTFTGPDSRGRQRQGRRFSAGGTVRIDSSWGIAENLSSSRTIEYTVGGKSLGVQQIPAIQPGQGLEHSISVDTTGMSGQIEVRARLVNPDPAKEAVGTGSFTLEEGEDRIVRAWASPAEVEKGGEVQVMASIQAADNKDGIRTLLARSRLQTGQKTVSLQGGESQDVTLTFSTHQMRPGRRQSVNLRLLDEKGKLQDSEMLRFKVKKPAPVTTGTTGSSGGQGGLTHVNCSETAITIKMWDDADQDGDIISLKMGNAWVRQGLNLNACGGPSEPGGGPCVFANLSLPRGSQVPISIYAHNQGDVGLNTAALRVIGGCTPESQSWGLETGDGATIYITGQ